VPRRDEHQIDISDGGDLRMPARHQLIGREASHGRCYDGQRRVDLAEMYTEILRSPFSECCRHRYNVGFRGLGNHAIEILARTIAQSYPRASVTSSTSMR